MILQKIIAQKLKSVVTTTINKKIINKLKIHACTKNMFISTTQEQLAFTYIFTSFPKFTNQP